MIIGAAVCPAAPLLAAGLTGREPVLPELRQACAAAVTRLAGTGPELVAVIGPGRQTATWPSSGRLDLAVFAPMLGRRQPGPPVPHPLGLGARLLDEAGYGGPRLLQSVGADDPGAACAALGAELARRSGRAGMLVMADGSARRSPRAPGHFDPRAAAFDAELERAVRDGKPGALRDLDETLARELLAVGRPAWQVLAGAMPGPVPSAEVLYADAPFGVCYLVAWLS